MKKIKLEYIKEPTDEVIRFEQKLAAVIKDLKMTIAKQSFDQKTLVRCVEYRRFSPPTRKEIEGSI